MGTKKETATVNAALETAKESAHQVGAALLKTSSSSTSTPSTPIPPPPPPTTAMAAKSNSTLTKSFQSKL
jgi:hypothetical protein